MKGAAEKQAGMAATLCILAFAPAPHGDAVRGAAARSRCCVLLLSIMEHSLGGWELPRRVLMGQMLFRYCHHGILHV